jgi:hypothetical protein
MVICNPRNLAFAPLIAALPVGFALAAGRGGAGGAGGAGVGAAGIIGSAAVGGGAPGGQVGGGPPAGAVGGGSPNSNNPAGNGSAGTGNPGLNAVGGGAVGNDTNAPGIPSARTSIGGYGDSTRAGPAPALPGGTSPEALSSQRSPTDASTVQKEVRGVAEAGSFSPTGLSRSGPDGVSTVIMAARACGVAAHETDGTTTCIGIPGRSPNLSRPHGRRATAD